MATFFCEAPSRLRTSSHISSAVSRGPARHALSPMARPHDLSSRTASLPTGRRDLSTTANLQARLIQRPQRPYHFTQVVQLSDGSTFTHRTTSPAPLHRATKDSRNHIIWQPSEKSLRNVEVDEAGRLAAFRARFGRSWDAATIAEDANVAASAADKSKGKVPDATAAKASELPADDNESALDTLADLLSGYAAKAEPEKRGGLSAKEQARLDKGGKKK